MTDLEKYILKQFRERMEKQASKPDPRLVNGNGKKPNLRLVWNAAREKQG